MMGEYVIALAGNPNTGKSTIFNALTGLNQHTGNWPGKTVLRAEGKYTYQGSVYRVIDLPGTYSLLANSLDEQVARNYLCFEKPDAVIVVVDTTCLERNLNLALQVLEITDKVVVCANLIDEAKRKKIDIDLEALARELGVPVVGTVATSGFGLDKLLAAVNNVSTGQVALNPYQIKYDLIIEEAIPRLELPLKKLLGEGINTRWLALRLLDKDQAIIEEIRARLSANESLRVGSELMV